MKVQFPAMKGMMGQRTYYACLMNLSSIPKMFTFQDWIEFRPEDREQRVLNRKRVPEISRYITENEDGYLFSSITASYQCEVKFKPVPDEENLGTLEMDFEKANFVINDGQHRCAAIAHALDSNPELGDEAISVLLFPYETRERVQQMFSDLNRNVAKTSKSLDILYDKRDPLSAVTLEVCEKVPAFQGMVEKDSVSLPVRSAKLFTLASLYDANSELVGDVVDDDATIQSKIVTAMEFWNEVAKHIPAWMKVKNGDLRAIEFRQESISSHSVVVRALGAVGGDLLKSYKNEWREKLIALDGIDWTKKNRDWENVCIVANSVVSNRQARSATKAYLKNKLGLALTEAEAKSIAHAAASDAAYPPAAPATPAVAAEAEVTA
jgi:DNA sulfur modification protein DndB